jgi:hypothetical protein
MLMPVERHTDPTIADPFELRVVVVGTECQGYGGPANFASECSVVASSVLCRPRAFIASRLREQRADFLVCCLCEIAVEHAEGEE